jgi:hypothetical protein
VADPCHELVLGLRGAERLVAPLDEQLAGEDHLVGQLAYLVSRRRRGSQPEAAEEPLGVRREALDAPHHSVGHEVGPPGGHDQGPDHAGQGAPHQQLLEAIDLAPVVDQPFVDPIFEHLDGVVHGRRGGQRGDQARDHRRVQHVQARIVRHVGGLAAPRPEVQ